MKNYNIKEFSFIKTPIVIEFTCIVILVYLFMSKHNDYLGVAVCLLVLIQQIYLIYRGMKFFYEFVNDIEETMKLVQRDSKLDVKKSLQDTIYSKLYANLLQIQESKKVYMENQKKELGVIHQLISDISHQVKTPITTAKTYGQMILKCDKESFDLKKVLGYISIITAQIDKLDFLMHSLIKISRLETNIVNLQPQICNVENILAESYVGVLHNAEKKNIHVYANYKGEHEVFVDYKWTIEAVFNIIDNAVKYTEQDGNIKIEIVASDNFEIISIADDGSGIEEDKIPLIFKRFYREEKSKQIEGVGLGLSLSKEIIEKEHGYIRVKSILHQGTTFYIYLPRREKESGNNG